jgi:hypothetical protein
MAAQGSAFRGFNITSPSSTQATFDAQMNAYIAYSGWGPSEPAIITTGVTTTSGGFDAQGNAIVAYTFQTAYVPASTVPSTEVAWYTWIVPTGATNGQQYQTIKYGNNTNPPAISITANVTFSNLLVHYSGSTNIPAGTYKVYTTKPGNGVNITNGGGNIFWQGGNLI